MKTGNIGNTNTYQWDKTNIKRTNSESKPVRLWMKTGLESSETSKYLQSTGKLLAAMNYVMNYMERVSKLGKIYTKSFNMCFKFRTLGMDM